MPETTPAFVCCSLLADELRRATQRLGLEEAPRLCFESACHLAGPPTRWPPPEVVALGQEHSPLLAVCMNCRRRAQDQGRGRQPISTLEEHGIGVLSVQTQGELLLGRDATDRALAEGAFLVLPGWLESWRAIVIDAWGFDAATAPAFFRESSKTLLFLDTGREAPWEEELAAMAAYVGLPSESRYVGTSHLEALLDRVLEGHRRASEQRTAARTVSGSRALAAEYAAVVDFITQLGSLPSEGAIIGSLEDTANILFAPREVEFIAGNGLASGDPSPTSFEVYVRYGGQDLGILVIREIAMAEHRDRYLPMARAICDAAAIAMNASRLYRREQDLTRELAQKVEELDQFAYIASHDLQAPLRRLVSFSELLVKSLGDDLPERTETFVEYIQSSALLMRTLVQDLLRLSRASNNPLRLERVGLDASLDRALDALAGPIEVSSTTIRRQPLPTIDGDPGLLAQLFQNLLGNAMKFVPEDRDPVVEVTVTSETDHWVISVVDNGIGVDPDYARAIFDPFKRLHASVEYEGSGIGLAICQRVAQRHGGELWVEPGPEQGSIFRFTLPKESPRAERESLAGGNTS